MFRTIVASSLTLSIFYFVFFFRATLFCHTQPHDKRLHIDISIGYLLHLRGIRCIEFKITGWLLYRKRVGYSTVYADYIVAAHSHQLGKQGFADIISMCLMYAQCRRAQCAQSNVQIFRFRSITITATSINCLLLLLFSSQFSIGSKSQIPSTILDIGQCYYGRFVCDHLLLCFPWAGNHRGQTGCWSTRRVSIVLRNGVIFSRSDRCGESYAVLIFQF